MSESVPLHRRVAFALDLARQQRGFLCPESDVVDELALAGLVTVKQVGDGFVIIEAVHTPIACTRGWYRSRWARRDAEQGRVSA